MGAAASGAKDANSFHAAMRAGTNLPMTSSLTYQGLFNQHMFHTGEPENSAAVAVAARATHVPASCMESDEKGKNDVWVGCFLKSCRDGQPRDGTPIDIVAVLDVSGSMGSGVGGRRSHGRCRLDLAKEALLGLLDQLREDDRFGLATFTSEGTVIQSLAMVRDLDREGLVHRVASLRAGGGTTLQAGMQAAVGICKDADTPSGPRHRRLLFLTDMDDLGSSDLNAMIAGQAKDGVYVSFVGIGMGFNSQLAEEVTKHRGANYFCITREDELKKVIVDDFDWNFFPAGFEVEVAQQSDSFDLMAVYGTPFDTREEDVQDDWHPSAHKFYPQDFKEQAKELLLCSKRYTGALPSPALQGVFSFLSPSARTIVRVDTVFPSAVQQDGAVEGGLILLRLRPRSADVQSGTVRLMLRYLAGGEELSTSTDLEINAPTVEASFDPAVAKGVTLQRFVEVCRSYLTTAHSVAPSAAALADALQRVEGLLGELEEKPDDTDVLCPGVRQELKDFADMARKHWATHSGIEQS